MANLNFSLTQIEYALAVYRFGHFAKAAEACHITQPTLSMQIQKLEEDLGLVLFDRSKKPILVTEMGREVIEQFQKILGEAKKVKSLVEKNKNGPIEGELIVAVIPTIAPYLLPLLLPQVESDWPGLKLRLKELQTHRIVQALENDEVDVGILATPLNEAKMFEVPLYYEPFSILCKNGHSLFHQKKVKGSQLPTEDLWLLEEGHCFRNQVLDICAVRGKRPSNRPFEFESGSLETLKNLVEVYGGYTLLPEMATGPLSHQVRLIPFERPVPAREIGLIYRREHFKLEMIEALGEAILSAIPERIRKLRLKDLDVLPIND